MSEFKRGFIKKAQELGISEGQAELLYKEAMPEPTMDAGGAFYGALANPLGNIKSVYENRGLGDAVSTAARGAGEGGLGMLAGSFLKKLVNPVGYYGLKARGGVGILGSLAGGLLGNAHGQSADISSQNEQSGQALQGLLNRYLPQGQMTNELHGHLQNNDTGGALEILRNLDHSGTRLPEVINQGVGNMDNYGSSIWGTTKDWMRKNLLKMHE
jgi:hypothetical protein